MDSFIAWIGGKKILRKEICKRFPEKVEKFVEVFGGAAWVTFYKEKHAPLEIYNDINSNLVNLFKCVKYHPAAIEEELELMLNARDFFNDCKSLYENAALTDIQRAARYLYMIKVSYGAKTTNFGGRPRDIINTEYLKKVKERLKAVVIENKSYDILIKQYDSENSLFYCDPPYYGAEHYYDNGGFDFNDEQHIELSGLLRSIKGKAVVSYNDSDFIRELYKDFTIEEIERVNTLATRYGKGKMYKELIIKNF